MDNRSVWESTKVSFFVLLFASCVVVLVVFFSYCFSAKKFNGYYLNHNVGEAYSIWLNWENAPDEIAFQTFDGEVALRVLKTLNENK